MKNAACDYTLNDDVTTRILAAPGLAGCCPAPAPPAWPVSPCRTEARRRHPPAPMTACNTARSTRRPAISGTTIFAADGQNGLGELPLGFGNCGRRLPKGKLAANAAGGFDYMENGASQARVFGFRNPGAYHDRSGRGWHGDHAGGKDNPRCGIGSRVVLLAPP
jgi:hypothetical protein